MDKILVVDDDPHIREVVCFALQKAGYATVSAENGKQALDCFGREKPSLVVLDILMPELDGTEVCRRLRAAEAVQRLLAVLGADRGIAGLLQRKTHHLADMRVVVHHQDLFHRPQPPALS